MWSIRFLNGPLAGSTFSLNDGTNIVGRAPDCDIVVGSGKISKHHAKIEMHGDKVIITDLGSRNGTFINGVQVQTQRLHPGDKVGLHEIIIEVFPGQAHSSAQARPIPNAMPQQGGYMPTQVGYPYNGNAAYQQQPMHGHPQMDMHGHPDQMHGHPGSMSENQAHSGIKRNPFVKMALDYIDDVVLPGVYRIPELLEFKWVLALFIAAFILFVTALSSVPLMRILKNSIEKESQRRALTIARTIAKINRPALMQGLDSAVTIEIAQREPGVDKALVISNIDGNIIAPTSQAGEYPDLPFIHQARKTGKEAVEQINDNTIGALVPIEFYNPETGSNSITAYAVVMYDMGTLAVDDGRTLSLFIQTFFIALIVGSILFFFLFKIIDHPIVSINRQLDKALKEGRGEVDTEYQFPSLESLCSNINSTLSRMGSDGDQQQGPVEQDRFGELSNLVELVGFAAMGIFAHDQTIVTVNSGFEERTGLNAHDLVNKTVGEITDQSLKLSLQDLIERIEANPHQIITNELDFSGYNYEIAAQGIWGLDSLSYYIVALIPVDEGGGES